MFLEFATLHSRSSSSSFFLSQKNGWEGAIIVTSLHSRDPLWNVQLWLPVPIKIVTTECSYESIIVWSKTFCHHKSTKVRVESKALLYRILYKGPIACNRDSNPILCGEGGTFTHICSFGHLRYHLGGYATLRFLYLYVKIYALLGWKTIMSKFRKWFFKKLTHVDETTMGKALRKIEFEIT